MHKYLFSQFIQPALKNVKNISAFRRGSCAFVLRILTRVVRYVLSAKNHELGYSIIINNSAIQMPKMLFFDDKPWVNLQSHTLYGPHMNISSNFIC